MVAFLFAACSGQEGDAGAVPSTEERELMAILGIVLLELQGSGKIMVTLERLQPVYHVMVARRY